MKRHLALILALAVIIAACGGDEGDSATTTAPPTIDPDQRILEVRYEGGFAPVEFLFSQPPAYTLYADGRLVFQGPQPAIFPGPLMPSLQVVDIGVDGLSQVLAAVEAAGLPDITEVINNDANQFVADAPNTVITYTDENGDHIYNVYALGITDQDPELNSLQNLITVLDNVAFSSPDAGEYPIEQLQVIVSPAFNDGGGDLRPTIEPWPLTTAPADLPDFVVELKCIVIDGAEAQDVLPIFQAANQLTFFEDGGTDYRFTVRPLLVGEEGCRAG
ncbi:MAG: hypothetical protein QNJ88_15495 [Acidimicrobiia bacterium]|nr:hypothetical protein [Acidimicrobiia bacterium]